MANRRSYTDEQLSAALAAARTWADVMQSLGKSRTRSAHDVQAVARRLGLDASHLDRTHRPSRSPFSSAPAAVSTSAIGSRTEGIVLAALMRAGRVVLVPFGSGHRYDLAVDDGGRLLRIQCKTARYERGCVIFASTSNRRDNTKLSYRGEADAFAVYCEALDTVYIVPIDDVAESQGRLRVDKARNGQNGAVRWAGAYVLRNEVTQSSWSARDPVEVEIAGSSPGVVIEGCQRGTGRISKPLPG